MIQGRALWGLWQGLAWELAFEARWQETVFWLHGSLNCQVILPSCAPQACGGSIQTSVNALSSDVLGRCQVFEETQIGGER